MSRLEKYIVETPDLDRIKTLIRHNCKPYLSLVQNTNRAAIRNLRMKDTFKEIKTRKDRKPMDTNIKIHNRINKMFKDVFNIAARSETVFSTANKLGDPFYSTINLYVLFPIGKFDYIYSNEIDDFTAYVDDFAWEYYKGDSTKLEDEDLEKMVDTYIINEPFYKIERYTEVMWKCDKYYLLNLKYILDKNNSMKEFFSDLI